MSGYINNALQAQVSRTSKRAPKYGTLQAKHKKLSRKLETLNDNSSLEGFPADKVQRLRDKVIKLEFRAWAKSEQAPGGRHTKTEAERRGFLEIVQGLSDEVRGITTIANVPAPTSEEFIALAEATKLFEKKAPDVIF